VAEDEQHAPRRRGYDVSRLLALSDGIFAIAMTLLVLDVPVPPHLAQRTDAALAQALMDLEPNLISFGLSFLLVALYWARHRRIFRDITHTIARLIQLNVTLLLLVCLVPFTAALLSRYGDIGTAIVVYAVNLAALGLALTGLQAECWRHGLLAPRPSATEHRWSMIRGLAGAAIFLSSIPIALVNPTAGYLPWLAMLAVGPVISRLSRRASPGRGGDA
jgi:uncharacterized membrane protein